MKVVNLMGRGPSLIRFSQLPKSNHVVLANDFARPHIRFCIPPTSGGNVLVTIKNISF